MKVSFTYAEHLPSILLVTDPEKKKEKIKFARTNRKILHKEKGKANHYKSYIPDFSGNKKENSTTIIIQWE